MKKTVILILAAAALLTSCAKPDKCKCTIKAGNVTVDNTIVPRPEDTRCSKLKIEDIKGDIVSIDLSKLASVSCVDYKE